MTVVLKSLAPKEAVAYLIRRGADLRPTWGWQEVWQEEHARAFVVAKMTQLDLLQEVHNQVLAAVEEGITLEEFKKRLVPQLQAAGWWGRKIQGDKELQLGSPERLRVIYDTNVRQAYAAGAWERFERSKADLPYLLYGLGPSRVHRVQHAGWAGTILPVDHPWWDTHAPINGWGCKCWLRQLTAAAAKLLGYDPETPAPMDRLVPFTKGDGTTVMVPEGIDPGFAYNPGKASARAARMGEVLGDKLLAADPGIAAQVMGPGGEALTQALQAAFQGWAEDVVQGGLVPQGQRLVVGAFSPGVVDQVEASLGQALASAAITVEDRELIHMFRQGKVDRGAALAEADLLRLPELLREPRAILWDQVDPAVLYVFDAPEGRAGKLVIRVNYSVAARVEGRKVRQQVNTIRTGGQVALSDLQTDRYRILEGSL